MASIIRGTFNIHREAGTLRERCLRISTMEEFMATAEMQKLLKDGAIEIVDKERGVIALNAIEGNNSVRVLKDFSEPRYICWEIVSEENRDKVPGDYGAWNKDNGATTLVVRNGLCYNKAEVVEVQATLITKDIPQWVKEAGFPVEIQDNQAKLLRTDWSDDENPEGTWRMGEVGKALWCYYGPGDINIIDVREESAKTYYVSVNGEEVCLADLAVLESII